MNTFLKQAHLIRNPFPPAATGMGGILQSNQTIFLPEEQTVQINAFYNSACSGNGVKIFPVVGAYGSGKTAILKGYLKNFFEDHDIKVFYFDNPGVEFYCLAETLMRSLGRYEFSKAIWESCKSYMQQQQQSLFELTFEEMMHDVFKSKQQNETVDELAQIIKNKLSYTDENEIAYKLATLVVYTHKKKFFERRDFISTNTQALVAENQEDKFFQAIIRAIIAIYNVRGVAFLIDEFEEVTFSRGMTKVKTYEYLSTFRRLIDISETEELWIAVAMTPEAMEQTVAANAALVERFTQIQCKIELNPFTQADIHAWLIWWLDRYRPEHSSFTGSIFPFPEEFPQLLAADIKRCAPRKLVKTCFAILADAIAVNAPVPLSKDFILEKLAKLFDTENSNVNIE